MENRSVSLLSSFSQTRGLNKYSSSILRLSREDQDRARRRQEQQTPRRSKTTFTITKKRKLSRDNESSDSDIVEVVGPSDTSQPLASSPRSRTRRLRRGDMEPSSDPQEEEMEQGLPVIYTAAKVLNPCSGGQIVNCPICNVSIAMEDANTHIDSGCKKKTLSSAPGASKSGAKDQWSKIWGSNFRKGKNKING